MKIYQQGDILLKSCGKPNNITKLKTDVLWKGESNHHKLRGKFMIGHDDRSKFFVHSKGCELIHEEHKTIKIPEGFYELGIVQNYDHFTEESHNVID